MRYLSLDYFQKPPEQQYFIHRINNSSVAAQPHTHDYYQICYVDQGEVLHCAGDAEVPLHCGDAFILPPDFIHCIRYPDNNAYIFSLAFDENMFHPGFAYSGVYRFMTGLKLDAIAEKHIGVRTKITLNEDQRYVMKATLTALLRESETCQNVELSAATGLIAAVMSVLSQAYYQDEQHRESLHSLTAYDNAMNQCIDYIDHHFTDQLNLKDIARRFAFSSTAFAMLFPRYTGLTPRQYIVARRIEYAMVLIRGTKLSMNEIARAIGYEEFSTFYRNFTGQVGVSPSQYRVSGQAQRE